MELATIQRAAGGHADHSHDLGLHLSHAREDIRVDGVRNGESLESLGLQGGQITATMIYSATDATILPPSVLHLAQARQLGPHLVVGPSLCRQFGVSVDARPYGDQLVFQLLARLLDLFLNLAAHTRDLQEDAICAAAKIEVGILRGAGDAATLELKESFT